MIQLLPLLAYFGSVGVLSRYHTPNIPVDPGKAWISTRSQILSFGANFFLPYLLEYSFSVNILMVILGMLVIDFEQYVSHYLFHRIPLLYRKCHRHHHNQTPIHPSTSFYNDDIEPVVDGVLIFLSLWLININFLEYFIVTSLAVVATVCDHTVCEGRVSFHNIHHSVSKHHNIEQPFFDIFDRIFGTLHPSSPLKIPFKLNY